MADLCLTADVMVDRILVVQGFTVSAATAAQRIDALARLNDGYRRFLRGDYLDVDGHVQVHDWSFLKVWATLELVDGTGTYSAPAGFGGLPKPFIYDYVSGTNFDEIEMRGPETVERLQRDSAEEGTASSVAVQPLTFVAATGQRWQFYFDPVPDTDRTVNVRYRLLGTALTDSNTVYPQGGTEFCDIILQAGKAEYERLSSGASGPEEGTYNVFMRAGVARDRASFSDDDGPENIAEADVGYTV